MAIDTVAARIPASPFPPDSPWSRCWTHYFEFLYRKSQSSATLHTFSCTLTHFFSQSANGGPAKSPDYYTREDVLAFIYSPTRAKGRAGKAPAGGSVNVRLTHISSFYKFSATYTIAEGSSIHPILERPSPTIGVAFGKVDLKYKAFSHDELKRLFAVIPTTVQGLRDKAAFTMYLTTARRRSEIADLRWGAIEQGLIVNKDGTRRMGWLFHFHCKGRKMEDDIAELPAMAKEALDRYLVASGRMASMRADSPLFTAWDKRQGQELMLAGGTLEYQLKQYARAASLDVKNVTLHVFRHTAAKNRYEAGEDLRSIQRLLRHSNIATTDRYIAQLMGTADEGFKLVESLYRDL